MNNYEDKKGVHVVPYQWSGHAGWEGGCAEGPPVLSCTRRMGTLNIIMCQLSIFGIGSSQKTEPRFCRVIRIFRKNLPAVPVTIILRKVNQVNIHFLTLLHMPCHKNRYPMNSYSTNKGLPVHFAYLLKSCSINVFGLRAVSVWYQVFSTLKFE